MTDYNIYRLTSMERKKYIMCAAVLIFIISFLFYSSWIFSFFMSFLAIKYPDIKAKALLRNRKDELLLQFKDMIYLLSVALSTGNSVENAFRRTLSEVKELYNNDNSYIIRELEYITKNIELNRNIEDLLIEFSKRAGIEDITNFVDVFVTCNAVGGNLNEVIRNTSSMISEKIEIENEIKIMLTQKKMEQKIISIIPVVIITMLTLTARDYIAPLFENISGRIVMTIVLLVVLVAIFISRKITDIKV